MAKRVQLRRLRTGTVINTISKGQEKEILQALNIVKSRLNQKFAIRLDFVERWYLNEIVANLQKHFPNVDFHHHFNSSHLRPDGGILFLVDKNGNRYPVLISEVKNQGTNDLRSQEGLSRQSKGNAIERLGKNVIGLRTAMLSESIFPFVCFGYGCDFASDSSILDRVTTIAMFGELNRTHLHEQGPSGEFRRGSFYFREPIWTVDEMAEIMFDIASRSVLYFFSKYREETFSV